MNALPSAAQDTVVRLRSLLFVAVLLLAVPLAHGQATRIITFDEAVNIALERNIELKKAANNVDVQAATVAQERASFLPNMTFSASPSRSFGLSFDQTAGRLISEQSDFMSVRANSGVNLFNGFADVASLSRARLNLEANDYTFDRQKQTVIFNVISNYLQVILDQEQVGIQEENVAAQQQQLTRIEEFTRVGTRPISDLYQQQATLANAELQLLNSEQAVQISEVRLLQVLELDPLQEYDFQAPTTDEVQLLPRDFDLNSLLIGAFDRRLDLKAQDARILAAGEGIRVARSGYFPSLSLNGGIGTSYSSQRQELIFGPDGSLLGREDIPFGSQFRDNRSGSLGFSLFIPVFDRLQTKTAIEQARVQYMNAQLDLQNLQQNVALDVRQAYLNYETAVKRLETTDKQLQAADQALQVEQERYNVGASTLVELTQARATFVQASSQRSQAVYQFIFQEKLIEYYQGILDPAQPLFLGQ